MPEFPGEKPIISLERSYFGRFDGTIDRSPDISHNTTGRIEAIRRVGKIGRPAATPAIEPLKKMLESKWRQFGVPISDKEAAEAALATLSK